MKMVMMSVNCSTDADVVKVMEVLSRAHLGLALEGYQVLLGVQDPDDVASQAPDDPQGGVGCRYPGPPCAHDGTGPAKG